MAAAAAVAWNDGELAEGGENETGGLWPTALTRGVHARGGGAPGASTVDASCRRARRLRHTWPQSNAIALYALDSQ